MKSVETKRMKLAEIKPAEWNPRADLQPGDPKYEILKKSLQEFGQTQTLTWNKATKTLLSGHQRLKVMLELGMKEADISVVNIKDSRKEKALAIHLNTMAGEFDTGKLKTIVAELRTEDFDMELTGFEGVEIEDMLEIKLPPDDPKYKEPDAENFLITVKIHKEKYGDIEKLIEEIREKGGEIHIS